MFLYIIRKNSLQPQFYAEFKLNVLLCLQFDKQLFSVDLSDEPEIVSSISYVNI